MKVSFLQRLSDRMDKLQLTEQPYRLSNLYVTHLSMVLELQLGMILQIVKDGICLKKSLQLETVSEN